MRFKIMAIPDVLIIQRMSKIGSLHKMAKLSGLSRQQLSYIENGHRGTSRETAQKIAGLLGMDMEALFEVTKKVAQ